MHHAVTVAESWSLRRHATKIAAFSLILQIDTSFVAPDADAERTSCENSGCSFESSVSECSGEKVSMKTIAIWALCLAFWISSSTVNAQDQAQDATSRIGQSISAFTLDNCYGKPVSLNDFDDNKIVVVAFLGTECPLAKLYGPRLNDIQTKYQSKGVALIGVNSNTQDSLTELAAYAHRFDVNFPLLKDVGNKVADAMAATRTPEVFVLDQDRIVRYHGRIDDQYGVGYSREREVHSDLTAAIDDMLAGKDVQLAETEAVGCHIGRVKKTKPVGEITYTKHIAAIFNARCVSCHREKEVAPFTLTSYEDVQGWEDTILEVIADNRMPPWSANPAHGKFANDARLSEQEKNLIKTWIDNGMPEGNASDLPEPPKFAVGWKIPEPDQVVKMSDTAFTVPAQGVVDYKRFVIDPNWDEDKYIVAAEARPQNRSVVHHILVYVVPPGQRRADLRQVLVGYAPGGLPVLLKDGVAIHVRAGSKLLFEMHYTPNGYEQTDLSYAGFVFTDKSKVKKRIRGRIAINPRFRIPAGDSSHQVVADYTARSDELLLSMTPHMHLRGKSFRYEARYPDGNQEILLDVPKYDFNWQLKYILDEPKRMPRGTKILCTATFDNSERNLSNPDPTKSVRWGDQSDEEMMIGFMNTVPVDEAGPKQSKNIEIDPTGKWTWQRKERGRTVNESVTLKLDGKVLTGQLVTSSGKVEIQDAVIDGKSLRFRAKTNRRVGLLLEFDATISEEKLTGNVDVVIEAIGRSMKLPWKAERADR